MVIAGKMLTNAYECQNADHRMLVCRKLQSVTQCQLMATICEMPILTIDTNLAGVSLSMSSGGKQFLLAETHMDSEIIPM